jgi:hypothetical protein
MWQSPRWGLKQGAEVKLTVEAEPEATTAKDEKAPNVSAA